MTTTTSRRAVLAGIAAAPALAAPIVAAVAITPVLAAPTVVKAEPPLDPDAELRRLWAQYCVELDAYDAAAAVHALRRAALDDELQSFYAMDCKGDKYAPWGGWQDWRDAHDAAMKKSWRKHKVGGPWRTMNKCADNCRKTAAAIREIEAQTLFGIGIKLVALPARVGELDTEDYVDALQSALPDLDKLCGGTFAEMQPVQS